MYRRIYLFALYTMLLIAVCNADDRAMLPFKGKVRMKPKTSIVRNLGNGVKPESTFQSLRDLRDTLKLIGDTKIRAIHDRAHGGFPDDHRVLEELKNVKVSCWIFAIQFEGNDDNDFHVIMSNSRTGSDGIFMTAEISGLPPSGANRALLRKVREDFLSLCSSVTIPSSHFVKLDTPIRVIVQGSLLFDNHHGANVAGPGWAKPGTSWEIHPVYSIEAGN